MATLPTGFIDDEPQEQAPDQTPQTSGFIDDPDATAAPDEVSSRLENPYYVPTLAEYQLYQQAQDAKPWLQPEDAAATVYEAGKAVATGAAQLGKYLTETLLSPDTADAKSAGAAIQTIAEGAARGTVGDVETLKKLVGNASSAITPGPANMLSFDQYAATKVAQMNQAKFQDVALTPENFNTMIQLADIPQDQLAAWRQQYDAQYVPQTGYQNFLSKRQDLVASIEQSAGHADLLPHLFGTPDAQAADAAGMFLSPTALALMGSGGAAKAGLSTVEKIAAATASRSGQALSAAGKLADATAALPSRALKAATETLMDSPELGTKAADALEDNAARDSNPLAKVLKPVSDAMALLRAGALPLSATGDALQAAGRAIEAGPSRTGMLAQIASDGASPKWLRMAAGSARALDPALSVAGRVGANAAEGAAYGAVLGGATDGEQGALQGAGSGGALGAGMGVLAHLTGDQAASEAAKQADLNRWFNSKSTGEQANIAALNLSADDALKYATLEQIARGVRGTEGEGDIHFVYADDSTFQNATGGSAKGAEFINGDQPTVIINTDKADAGTLPHEVFHGLLDLAGTPDAKAELMSKLFSQVAPDGTMLHQGIFSPDDMARAQAQYEARLSPPLKAQWMKMTPDEQGASIRGELASDAFANLVKANNPSYLLNGLSGVKRRMADSIIQAQDSSILGRLRDGLKSAGVTFDSSGTPSELFTDKTGKPITNSPTVNAALRDYLRARDKVRVRVTADEDAPSASVVTRQDLMSKDAKTIAGVFKDNDNFAKDANGNVKFQGGQPILLSDGQIRKVQSDRVDSMLKQLDSVPDSGEVGAVRKKSNGAYEGTYFTDSQLDAFDRVPNHLLSPEMKKKLRDINALHRLQDGTRMVLDYNAATKEKAGGGRIYSSGIKSSLRDVVPISMHISKAGNFYNTTADTTVLFAKLNRWMKDHKSAFDAWGGDRDAVIRDAFKYLDNHANGREGSIGLDSGRATAITKKNVLNDLFGVARGTGNNPIELSSKAGKDQIIRSFRFDRTNRITRSGGDPMPFDYYKQKANFLPSSPALQGNEFTATTPIAGTLVKGRYEVHEASDLVSSFDKGFDPTLQPRDRSRAASANQIASIVQKFEPQRLGEAPTTDMGAPVVDDQRQVLSGNGRTSALRTVYGAQDPARADTYRDYLLRNADQFGFKPADLQGMKEPVLVRRVDDYGGLSKAEFARQSNQSQLLAMSGGEKAAADARMLTENPALLDRFAPSEEGNVLASSNNDFLNQFIQATGDSAELLGSKGYNQQALKKRVETAIMATILGPEHRDLISKITEQADKFKIRKAVAGVMQSGAKLIKLKGTPYDLGGHLQEAMSNLIRMRGSGEKIEDFLASKPLIGNADRTAAGDQVLQFLASAKSMKQVSEDLGRYSNMAQNAIADGQSGSLFGDAPRTREQLVAEIYGQLQRNDPQYPGASQASQPPGQPAPVAVQPPAQPSAPSVAPQPVAPVVQPTTPTVQPADVTPVPAALPPRSPAPYQAPAFLSRPLPAKLRPVPSPGMIFPNQPLPEGVSSRAVAKHTQAQTISDLAHRIAQAGTKMTTNVRESVASYYVKRLDSELPEVRNQSKADRLAAISRLSARLTPADLSAISTAIRTKGMNAARALIEQTAKAQTT